MGNGEFAEFFAAQFASACRYAYTLCGNHAESEEIAQQAFVRMYSHWRRVRRATAQAYLRKTVTRLFINTRRGRRGREHAMADVPERPVEQEHSELERQGLRAALLRVPPRQRAVLVLRFVYDLPIDEVAAALGCSPGTVKSQAAHGLGNLRKAYGDLFTGSDIEEVAL
ncbi:SigE family RNA polymerase sigma factor [Haloactinomyces albus]|uniref:RNA polymerase sigma-70 factor (Sigma-E family) n=1 Tax=Haloactinomyces albus TaxID=1352928 RepID=A0AAE4CPM0_9ACTN|nr:SigE family RNA polymerase sigma factor [Haloactinomyces albus]MDR7303222.1 RNA polymerase sigma-70 factor (sigma-E family) [Haloactinomyces albus]MDR7304642.1 RNA polymerase sigma-70 factor (sigma-E family) [Haloactinomyces albus]